MKLNGRELGEKASKMIGEHLKSPPTSSPEKRKTVATWIQENKERRRRENAEAAAKIQKLKHQNDILLNTSIERKDVDKFEPQQ